MMSPLNKTRFTKITAPGSPFQLSSGEVLESVQLAYKIYGKLSPRKDNVILLFPVLTTSQHASGYDEKGPGTPYWSEHCYVGWWDSFVGPGKALDTDQFCVICANYLGSCFGSTGPLSIDPQTNKEYGKSYPPITVEDIVNSQVQLVKMLGVTRLHAVVGASFGGYLAYDLARRYPHFVERVVSIASGCRVTAEMRHSNLSQILAIECDRDFQEGRYHPEHPRQGLALARFIALKTYISLDELGKNLDEKFKDTQYEEGEYAFTHPSEEFFLRHAKIFPRRFDAHSYLLLLRAWQRFYPGFYPELGVEKTERISKIRKVLAGSAEQSWLLFSIKSDGCFPPAEQRYLQSVLEAANIVHYYVGVESNKGHDSFLGEPELYLPALCEFLQGKMQQTRLKAA